MRSYQAEPLVGSAAQAAVARTHHASDDLLDAVLENDVIYQVEDQLYSATEMNRAFVHCSYCGELHRRPIT